MREASITELRKNIKRLLDAVEAGDTVRGTRNGRTVADAVQVGCALAFRSDAFFTADRRQAAAARSLGLVVQLL